MPAPSSLAHPAEKSSDISTAATGQSAMPASAVASQPLTPPPPLDLTLRRSPAFAPGRNPALDDLRSNTQPISKGDRLGRALGTDDFKQVVEAFGEGRYRIRDGASCLIVEQSRSAQLNPFDEAARARSPNLARRCP
jgi:hypothetical protein